MVRISDLLNPPTDVDMTAALPERQRVQATPLLERFEPHNPTTYEDPTFYRTGGDGNLGKATQWSKSSPIQHKRRSRNNGISEAVKIRRAKQRRIVRECYYKKINTLQMLKDEVEDLEKDFSEKAQRMEKQIQSPVKQKDLLRDENQQLRQQADRLYVKNQGRMQKLLDANFKGLQLFTPHED